MIKVILVDDEVPALVVLEGLLSELCPEVEILGKATSCVEGLKLIQEKKPDLVFLDINMPGGDGFDLLELTDHAEFEVVFTTAYEKHALRAIKIRPFDYLLKPIDPEELISTVKKFHQFLANKNSVNLVQDSVTMKIKLSSARDIVMVSSDEVVYLEAEGRYTKVFLSGGQSKLITKNIGDFEKELSAFPCFFRSHRSYLINLDKISRFIREDSGYVEMINGARLEISPKKKSELMEHYLQKTE